MTMTFLHIKEAEKKAGQKVNLRGWIYRHRQTKKFVFIVLRDVTGTLQCIIPAENESLYNKSSGLLIESSIEISGTIKKDDRAPTGYELSVESLNIISPAERFPITKDQSTEFLLDVRHLWIRSQKLKNIFVVRDEVLRAAREYFHNRKFYEVNGPMFVPTKGEEGSELFELKYFDRKVYLTQTAQMYLEAAIFSLEKVFTIGPAFRAEKSRTRKHVTEFLMLEAEEAFCDLDGLLKTQEELVSHIVQSVIRNCGEQLKELDVNVENLKKVNPPFERIKYEDAIKILQKKGSKIKHGEDIGTDDEKLLTADKEKPVFITHWPRKIKAFYMKVNPENPETVLCADMQAPKGYAEISGSSVREESSKIIIENLKKEGDDPKKYKWYLELRDYGSVPHAGFGIGIARLISWICSLDHIRDAIPFPRMINRVYP